MEGVLLQRTEGHGCWCVEGRRLCKFGAGYIDGWTLTHILVFSDAKMIVRLELGPGLVAVSGMYGGQRGAEQEL